MTKTIKIKGMSCENCVRSVETALNSLKGISAVELVDLDKKIAVVEVNGVRDQEIKDVIDDIGFEVVGIE